MPSFTETQASTHRTQRSNRTVVIVCLIILAACGNNPEGSAGIENFCQHVAQDISKRSRNPYTVDGSVITSSSLPYLDTAPACVIYFSSKLLGGDGKIVHKQYTAKELGGL